MLPQRAQATSILNLVLVNPNPAVALGTTVIAFDATISNTSATDTVYLNGDAPTSGSPRVTIGDSPFAANAPLMLAPGSSSGPFELFAVDLDPSTPAGLYTSNVFSILGGADGGTNSLFDDLADAEFTITVTTPSGGTVPEPATWLLLATGLAGWLASPRRRRG